MQQAHSFLIHSHWFPFITISTSLCGKYFLATVEEFFNVLYFYVFWTSAVLKYDRIIELPRLNYFCELSFFNHSGITCTYVQSHSWSIVNFLDLSLEFL